MAQTTEHERTPLVIHHVRLVRVALAAGVAGPAMLAVVITGLTVAQYQFMRSLGWHPWRAPTVDWPSGLALGPYGEVMVVTFVASGMLLLLFAAGLRELLPSVAGPIFLGTAGVGMMLMAFKVDASYLEQPRSWHNNIHDAAFGLLGVSLLCAFVAFGISLSRRQGWRGFARWSLLSAMLVVPAITIKGVLFYLFLINTLTWIAYIARRLRRLTRII
jgi:hypothetical protein